MKVRGKVTTAIITAVLFLVTAMSSHASDQNNNNIAVSVDKLPAPVADLEQRGNQLRSAIETTYNKLSSERKINGLSRIDVSAIVAKYVPLGTTFKDAETILKAAGITLAPPPPRPPQVDNPHYDRFSLRGGVIIHYLSAGNVELAVLLVPEEPGSPDTHVKEAHGLIILNTL